jgi:hypothetical protein
MSVEENNARQVNKLNINVYQLQHDDGICFFYKNDTSDKVLKETVTFTLEGLKIEGQKDNSVVEINLNPG